MSSTPTPPWTWTLRVRVVETQVYFIVDPDSRSRARYKADDSEQGNRATTTPIFNVLSPAERISHESRGSGLYRHGSLHAQDSETRRLHVSTPIESHSHGYDGPCRDRSFYPRTSLFRQRGPKPISYQSRLTSFPKDC